MPVVRISLSKCNEHRNTLYCVKEQFSLISTWFSIILPVCLLLFFGMASVRFELLLPLDSCRWALLFYFQLRISAKFLILFILISCSSHGCLLQGNHLSGMRLMSISARHSRCTLAAVVVVGALVFYWNKISFENISVCLFAIFFLLFCVFAWFCWTTITSNLISQQWRICTRIFFYSRKMHLYFDCVTLAKMLMIFMCTACYCFRMCARTKLWFG